MAPCVTRDVPQESAASDALASGAGARRRHDDDVAGAGEAELLAGDLLDEIGVGDRLVEEPTIALKAGTHDLEASCLALQNRVARDQSGSGLEAVPALDRMMDEVSRQPEAEDANQHPPRRTTSTDMGRHTRNFE